MTGGQGRREGEGEGEGEGKGDSERRRHSSPLREDDITASAEGAEGEGDGIANKRRALTGGFSKGLVMAMGRGK